MRRVCIIFPVLVWGMILVGSTRACAQGSDRVTVSADAQKTSLPVYFGMYGPGIFRSVLDLETGSLTEPQRVAETQNPSFLTVHPSRKFLYCVSELGRGGGVRAYRLDAETGALAFLNEQSSGGGGPCHVSTDHAGKNVLVANYGGGSVSVIPIQPDGRLAKPSALIQHQGSSIDPQRQQGPHAHSVNVSPDDRFAFVADLGIDKVMIYRLNVDKGTLKAGDSPYASLAPGAGPRHFAFAPNGKFAYVINELNGTVTAFTYAATSGTLTEIQTLPTLPADFDASNKCAEVCLHPSGKFLYASNRGHDSIAVYQVDPQQGTLGFVEHECQDIKTPRNFNVDPTGRFCLVANQDADSVVVFRIDAETGALDPTGHSVTLKRPVCVRFY